MTDDVKENFVLVEEKINNLLDFFPKAKSDAEFTVIEKWLDYSACVNLFPRLTEMEISAAIIAVNGFLASFFPDQVS